MRETAGKASERSNRKGAETESCWRNKQEGDGDRGRNRQRKCQGVLKIERDKTGRMERV